MENESENENDKEKEHEHEHDKLPRIFPNDAYEYGYVLLCCMTVTYINNRKLSCTYHRYAPTNKPTQIWLRRLFFLALCSLYLSVPPRVWFFSWI